VKCGITEIKQISIKSLLEARGVHPTTDRGHYGLYNSPLREDRNASFKVDFERNLWCDFGTYEGGSVIDLVMRLEGCSCGEAMRRLEGDTDLIQLPEITRSKPRSPELTITAVKPLEHYALIKYMENRAISPTVAAQHCNEVHYRIGEKSYFAVGFRNNLGGWELRNAYFKGGSSPKGITTSERRSDEVIVFEGFMDYLSFLSLRPIIVPEQNVLVLNSVANLHKALPFLRAHRVIRLYLDNDPAGRKAAADISRLAPGTECIDYAPKYAPHKDVNDYLLSRSKR